MKTKNLFMFAAAVGIMTFASCKKDESPAPLTKIEAEAALTSTDSKYATVTETLDASTEVAVMNAVSGLNIPFGTPTKSSANIKSFQKDLMNSIKPSSVKGGGDMIDPMNYFDFNTWKGTWSNTTGTWTQTLTTPVDKVVFLFSYDTGTDNGSLTYSGYEEKTYTSTPYISKLTATMSIGVTVIASWNYTATMSSDKNFDVKYVFNLGKFTKTEVSSIKTTLSQAGVTTNATMLYELKMDGNVVISKSANATMIIPSQGIFTLNVTANFRVGDIIVNYIIRKDQTTNTQGDPSNYLTITVWTTGGAKVADVIFVQGDGYEAYFKFIDGTTALVESYPNFYIFRVFADELESLGSPMPA